MKDSQKNKSPLIVWMGSITLIAALCAWVAGAATNPGTGTTGNNALTIPGGSASQDTPDPAIQSLLDQNTLSVQNQQNTAILQDMYNATRLSPTDTLLTQHLSGYCNDAVATGACTSDPSLMFGDTKVSSVLGGSSYDSARQAAAQAFLDTLLTAVDSSGVSNFQSTRPINADTLSKNPTLKQQFVQALSDEAVLSVVREAFAGMIAKRTPPTAAQGAEATPSEMALMEQEALKRWMNKTWSSNFAKLSPAEMQQDMAAMQASQLWTAYQSYRQMERVEALLAVLVLQNYRTQKNTGAIVSKTTTVPDNGVDSINIPESGDGE